MRHPDYDSWKTDCGPIPSIHEEDDMPAIHCAPCAHMVPAEEWADHLAAFHPVRPHVCGLCSAPWSDAHRCPPPRMPSQLDEQHHAAWQQKRGLR